MSAQNKYDMSVTPDVCHVEMWPYVTSAAALSESHAEHGRVDVAVGHDGPVSWRRLRRTPVATLGKLLLLAARAQAIGRSEQRLAPPRRADKALRD